MPLLIAALCWLALTACAEEEAEVRGSFETSGVGLAIPWWFIGLLVTAYAVVQVIRSRR